MADHTHTHFAAVLFFQSDSLFCSRSEFTVNDFLGVNETATEGGYAWVGAPWDLRGYPAEPWGGNGGLSIRRRSVMLNVTRTFEWDGPSEDLWFTNKIFELYEGTHLFPSQHTAMRFSWEGLPEAAMNLGDWPYEPMGIHTGTGWAACAKRGWDRIHKVSLYHTRARRRPLVERSADSGHPLAVEGARALS